MAGVRRQNLLVARAGGQGGRISSQPGPVGTKPLAITLYLLRALFVNLFDLVDLSKVLTWYSSIRLSAM
jgi:hypothetical protein